MSEMPPPSDAQLLRDYAEHGADAAFTELVHRHTNLVYSAAWRQVDSPDAAAEIAQRVFISLAHGAHELAPRLAADASLAGWLCRSTRNLSLNHRRDEFRRQNRERLAMENLLSATDAAPDWEQLRRVLDDTLSELDEPDYDALVLRFFQQQDFRSVGVALGVSDDTAQKRVSRALEKLREHLAKRGLRTPAAALAAVIAANAIAAALTGLAATISAAALLAGTITTTTIITTSSMHWLNLKAAAAIIAAVLSAGTITYLVAHKEVNTLKDKNTNLNRQVSTLNSARDEMTASVNDLKAEIKKLNQNQNELLRLRGEVGVLRRQILEAKQASDSMKAGLAAQQNQSAAQENKPMSPVAQANACINNLRQIDAAMQQCALEHRLSATNIVTAEQILPYLMNHQLPQCPAGGTYTFGSLSEIPVCSIPGHALPASIGSPAGEQIAGTIISAILKDLNSPTQKSDLAEARAAYQQEHNRQASGSMSEFILYLKNPGPLFRAALEGYKQIHSGQMPTNVLELAPFFQ